MRRILYMLLILSGLPVFSIMAQVTAGKEFSDKPLRIEIPARSVNETYRIIPCGARGMIVFFRSQEMADDARVKWYFSLYDTNLQLVWVKSVPVLNELDFRFHQFTADTLALLFVHTGKSRGTENDFEILRIGFSKGTMILNFAKIQADADVAGFGIREGVGWLACNVKGQAGKLLNMKLASGVVSTFPLGQGTQITVRWMQPDSASHTVLTVVSRQISKKLLEHYLVRYDTIGAIKREVPVGTQDFNHNLTHVKYLTGQSGSELILGSYGQEVTIPGQKNKLTDESAGFFASLIRNGVQQSVSYYNFLEMGSASALLNEHDMISLKKKALKKNKPLDEYSVDFSLLLHDVFTWHDQYILAAEIYAPQYHTESFTDFDYYGRPYTNSFSVFDGYRFFNTLVTGFDKDGKLLWDNTFEIRNVVSMDLSQKVVVFPAGDDLALCYITDGMAGTKIIHENTVVEKPDFAPIDLLYPDDKIISDTKSKIVPWYGNYFITYGYQEIKNVVLPSNNKRLVFYFSKLSFEK